MRNRSIYSISNGDKADVKFKSGKEFTGELVSISDSAVYLATIPGDYRNSPVLFYLPNNEIKSIEVQGYDGGSWLPWVMLFQVLPAGLLTGAAGSVDGTNVAAVGIISVIPAIITSICFGTTKEHTPKWNDNLPIEEIKLLKIYSRYPEALNETELNKLLRRYNQKSIKKYF